LALTNCAPINMDVQISVSVVHWLAFLRVYVQERYSRIIWQFYF
jgi:hypothetical protein